MPSLIGLRQLGRVVKVTMKNDDNLVVITQLLSGIQYAKMDSTERPAPVRGHHGFGA